MEHDIEEICIKPDITAISIKIEAISSDESPGTATDSDIEVEENSQDSRSINEELSKNKDSAEVLEKDTEKRISCPICGSTFKTRAYQKQHLKYAHPTEEDVVECPQCHRSFKSIAHLRYHNRSVHADIEEVTCKICQKNFQTKKRLVSHMYTVHPDPGENVSCDICKKGFKKQHHLKAHLRNVHVSEENYVICPHCDKKFKNNVWLNRHVKRSHPVDETVYRCQECNKIFPSIISYRDHIANVHTSENIECPICLKTIKKNLPRHMKIMHGDEKPVAKKYKVGNLKCSHCDKRFAKKTTLSWHIDRCHSENRDSTGNRGSD